MNDDNIKVVIPARKNSSRFPLKHFEFIGKKQVYEYTFDFALKNVRPKNIWVNTDDEKLIEIAKEKGMNFFKRPAELANDYIPTVDVLKHQIKYFDEHNIECKSIIILQLTNPFRPVNLLQKALKIFRNSKNKSLATFSKLNHKVCKISDNKFSPINYKPGMRSQDMSSLYFENGLLYISSCESIMKSRIITDDVYPLIISEPHAQVDIDYKEDLMFAEYILKKIKI